MSAKKKSSGLRKAGAGPTPILPGEEQEVKVPLIIEASIRKGALYLRQEIAEAKLPDGGKVEIALNMGGGAILVTRYPKESEKGERGDWTTYVFTPQALVEAVLSDMERK